MRLGVHLRIAKGLQAALADAERLGCETIQIFAGNPNAWKESHVRPEVAEEFRAGADRLGLDPIVLHTAYLLNLAAADDLVYARSTEALRLALDRAKLLNAQYVVTHIGSHGGCGYQRGACRIREAVVSALDRSPGPHMLLLEGGSGSGNTIGARFEDMADLLRRIGSPRVGIALDTAHLWGAGYDVSDNGLDETLVEFDRKVGLSHLRLFHCNDTQVAPGSKRDRHWHIGEGNIGIEGFRALVNHPAMADIPGILETPMDEPGWDARNLNLLRSFRISRPQDQV